MTHNIVMKDLLITTIVLVAIDSIYIYFIKDFFGEQIRRVQGTAMKINLFATFLCYVTLGFALYYFIIRVKKPLLDALILGLVIYIVYETTNLATLKAWSTKTVIIDSLWGGVLFVLATMLTRRLI